MSDFFPKRYVKAEPYDPINKQLNLKFTIRSRVLPYALPTVAVFLLATQVVLPLISFSTQDEISRPASQSALGYVTGFSEFDFKELNTSVLGTTSGKATSTIPEYFFLTVPKLRIENALVETNAKTLNPDLALGHYTGSALPGEVGNTFIYGHSVLPFFYNPDNYKTIFSTLHNLEVGDEVIISYNNKKLTYKVEKLENLRPQDVEPLAELKPAYLNESTLVLMTCSPAGTKIKRLLVQAVLVN